MIVGGGISGLTTAHRLKKAGVDVCLLEAGPEVGGCTRTESRDGFLLEKGPFNIMVRSAAFEGLLDDLSDEVDVVSASRAARVRYIYRRGALHPVPSNPIALATTKLLSPLARARLLRGVLLSRRATSSEETIEQVASRRFGTEVTDTMISAVIAGIFSGDISRLNLTACFPAAASIDATYRSLLGYGLRKALGGKRAPRRWPGLVSLNGGLGALTHAMGRRLGTDLLTSHAARATRAVDGGFEVDFSDAQGENGTMSCRRLVIGTPAACAADLLRPHLPQAHDVLSSIESASLVVLNLGFRTADVGHPMEGFGFLVPRVEPQFPLMGVLWADSIFPHYAPPDHRLIRVFIGGSRHPEAVSQSDEALQTTAIGALKELLGLRGDPVLADVCRYRSAIPQYHCGHREKIEKLRTIVSGVTGLHLVGNYLQGVSVNDCVQLGADVAEEIIKAGVTMPSASTTDRLVSGAAVG